MMYKIINKLIYFFVLPIWLAFSMFVYTCQGEIKEQYTITPSYIEAPLNKIILVKKGDEIGAFKFTKSTENNAEYIWYYPLSMGLSKQKSIRSGMGYLSDKFFSFIGRLSFQFGTTKIKCGSLKLMWSRGTSVSFYDLSGTGWSSAIEMAPTKEEDINAVDINAPYLSWYKYDEKRKITNISLDRLQSQESVVRKESRIKKLVK